MSGESKTLRVIGGEALWQLQTDVSYFEWIETLTWAISREAEREAPSQSRIKNLAEISNYLASDRAASLGEQCEQIEREIDACGGEL